MSHVAQEIRVGYALEQQPMTADAFLAWDQTQTVRHEFVRGEVFAMAGGEDNNNTVALNLALALRQHLRGTPCRVFANDVKLRVDAADCFFYPDLMVTCSDADRAQRLIKREPVLVVEVLSPATAGYDRGDKFADYRQLPSLAEYVLMDVNARRCDLFRKSEADGLWVLYPTGPDEALHLASVGLHIGADSLWADVDAPADPAGVKPPSSS